MTVIDADDLADAGVAFLTEAIAAVTRDVARTVPAPRGAPFFHLDMRRRDPVALEAFCRHGIFRKYERVLIVGSGLGGAARWWALRFGCSVLGVDAQPAAVRAAAVLSRRSGLRGRTQFQIGHADALPLRDGRFTHVWIARELRDTAHVSAVLREVYRVIRPGGSCAGLLDPRAPVDAKTEALRAAGFVGVEVQTLQPGELSSPFHTALRQLQAAIERRAPAVQRRPLEAFVTRAQADADDDQSVLQFMAQRPS